MEPTVTKDLCKAATVTVDLLEMYAYVYSPLPLTDLKLCSRTQQMHSNAKKHLVDTIPVHLHGITHDVKPKKCKIFYDDTNTAWPPAYPCGYCCRDLYISVLIFHPFLPFTRLPYCYPFALNSFLVAKTGLGLYRTMPSTSGLFGLYCCTLWLHFLSVPSASNQSVQC